MPRGTLDYSKWDSLDDEEEVRKDELTETSSSRNTDAQRQNNHIESMRLIAEWVKDAYPRLAADGVTHLVRFIALQHRGIHRDNTSRHVEITAFLEAYEAEIGPEDSREHDDLLHAMLALGHLCVRRLDEADTAIRARANSVLTVVQGAINTLWASRCEGGPRALFSLLLKEPHGGIATKYRGYKYASEVVTDPPEDPRDRPGPEPTFVTKLGRAVFMQLAVGTPYVHCLEYLPRPFSFMPS